MQYILIMVPPPIPSLIPLSLLLKPLFSLTHPHPTLCASLAIGGHSRCMCVHYCNRHVISRGQHAIVLVPILWIFPASHSLFWVVPWASEWPAESFKHLHLHDTMVSPWRVSLACAIQLLMLSHIL